MMMKRTNFFALILLAMGLMVSGVGAQTIAEKKASFGKKSSTGDLSKEMQAFLMRLNTEMKEQKTLLKELYNEARDLYSENATPAAYKTLLDQIKAVKQNIKILENSWREMSAENNRTEDYALWHQPDTTIGDLVIDYGSQDYVYLFDQKLSEIPLSVNSNIPIPSSNWSDMLQVILTQNGIGIKELNPYLRQLYLLKEDHSTIRLITNNRHDLDAYPDDTRACFVISPELSEVRRIWFFLEKFANENNTELQVVGRDILIISQVSDVRELLKLYDFVQANSGSNDYKIVTLKRVNAEQMSSILFAIFDQLTEEVEAVVPASTEGGKDQPRQQRPPQGRRPVNNGLKIIPLAHIAQALFLIGTPEEIKKAEDIIYQVESEVGDASEKVIFTYNCMHADTEELADILERVYNMMIQSRVGLDCGDGGALQNVKQKVNMTNIEVEPAFPSFQQQYSDGFYQQGEFVVNPAPLVPGSMPPTNPDPNRDKTNFIVDPKTGAIVMVVEAIALPKLKDLIRKLDVPKKMVQIEVLLFEKAVNKDTEFGLSLLRLGDNASKKNIDSITFRDNPFGLGILDFLFSRKGNGKGGNFSAFDIAYKFLLSRDDITINSNPSIVTINQTTASIKLVDEISINTGIFLVETPGGNELKDAFTRAQYGITIQVTPTIHMANEDSDFSLCGPDGDITNFITLETDITFDTFKRCGDNPDQPDVARRNIQNYVRIADGQTVIIGGLRSKVTEDDVQSIPFIGEIPFFGKFFSFTKMMDKTKEMFICITPRIISDPSIEMEILKCEEVRRRPGDIPAFLCRLEAAREHEKRKILQGYLTMIFGRPPERCYYSPGEYDGR
jgi:general secretion pathway protein D